MTAPNNSSEASRLTCWVMLAVFVWGLALGLGGYLAGGNHPLLRAVIITGSTLVFLAFWALALRLRHPQEPREES